MNTNTFVFQTRLFIRTAILCRPFSPGFVFWAADYFLCRDNIKPSFCSSDAMQHINHCLAAAFLQDVWLCWLRHLQMHNAAPQGECLLTRQNYDFFDWIHFILWNLNVTKHKQSQIVVTNKDTDSKNKRNGSQFVSKRSFVSRKRRSIYAATCWQRHAIAGKKPKVHFFLQVFAQKKASLMSARHPPASSTLLFDQTVEIVTD